MTDCEFKGICYSSPLNSDEKKPWCSDMELLEKYNCICDIRRFIVEESNRIIEKGVFY